MEVWAYGSRELWSYGLLQACLHALCDFDYICVSKLHCSTLAAELAVAAPLAKVCIAPYIVW